MVVAIDVLPVPVRPVMSIPDTKTKFKVNSIVSFDLKPTGLPFTEALTDHAMGEMVCAFL